MNKFYMPVVALLVALTVPLAAADLAAPASAAKPPSGAELADLAGKAGKGSELLRQFDAAEASAEGSRFQSLGHGQAWKERAGVALAAAAGVDGGLFEAAAAPFQAAGDGAAWVAAKSEPPSYAAARQRRLDAIRAIEAEVGLEAGTLE